MIGFHLQGNVDDWPAAVRRLPAGAPLKVVDGVQRCVEAKAVNPGVYTVVRHHVSTQNPTGDMREQARRFFDSFIDASFMAIAGSVDAVQELNEYFANSQTNEERQRWVEWITACVDVWREEYRTRPGLEHIDLILAETAVGNDIPLAVARIAHENPFCVLGYHPYIPVWRGELHPQHWQFYSGRWATMDANYLRNGYRVRWFFGEFGAVGLTMPGWPNSLAPNDGWRHPRVYDGNLAGYLDMMTEWASLLEDTQAWQEGRVLGAVLFTSGGGSQWKHFEVAQPEMGAIAAHVNSLRANMIEPGEAPEMPPPVEPPPPVELPEKGTPRVQYERVVLVAPPQASLSQWLDLAREGYADRRTIGFSYDDAGIGDLEKKTAVLYDVAPESEMAAWYRRWYPGTVVKYGELARPRFMLSAWPADVRVLTQRFGENYAEYRARFGIAGHNGIDLATPMGSPVYAAEEGIVLVVAEDPDGYGLYMDVAHEGSWLTRYAHLKNTVVSMGVRVEAGQQIARSGNSGFSTGPHLHFELRRPDGEAVNPLGYL